MKKIVDCCRLREDGRIECETDCVAEEIRLCFTTEDNAEHEVMCSPSMTDELIRGYRYLYDQMKHSQNSNERSSFTFLKITPEDMMDFEEELLHASELFCETGSTHTAGIFLCGNSDRKGCIAEDISRFQALYKVIGRALELGMPLEQTCLCTTGRLPKDYIEKIAYAGIPCAVSRSAPTDAALKEAKKYGIRVAGFAGAKRINLYQTLQGSAILAGGRAVRAGGIDKAFLQCRGQETFLSHLIHELPPKLPIMISYNRETEKLNQLLEQCGDSDRFMVLPDERKEIGPLGGLEAILKQSVRMGIGMVFVIACDMPYYHREIGETLLREIREQEDALIIRTEDGRNHTLCGVYRSRVLGSIHAMIQEKDYRLQHLLDRVRTRYIPAGEYGFEESWFTNINSMQEYQQTFK